MYTVNSLGFLPCAAALLLAAPLFAKETKEPPVAESPAASVDLTTLQQQLFSEDKAQRDQAREALEKLADTEAKEAALLLGDAWLRGLLSEKPDAAKAIDWWVEAGEAGNNRAWLLLGALHAGELGNRDLLDETKATGAFRRAAESGEAAAYLAIGSRLLNGIGCEANEQEGMGWLDKAVNEAVKARKENRRASFFAYVVAARYFVGQDKEAVAIQMLEKGVEREDPDCMLELSRMLVAEARSAEEKQKALQLLEKAADMGLPAAVQEMVPVERSKEQPRVVKIYEWLQKAAASGNPAACYELGLLYYQGGISGVPDRGAAAPWLSRAAQAGMAAAQYLLATQLEAGADVPRNLPAAFSNYQAAQAQGHPAATLGVARFTAEGGFPEKAKPDLPHAWAMAKLAKDRAEAIQSADWANQANTIIGDLSGRMEPGQFADAKKQYEALAKTEKTRLAEIAKREEAAKAAVEAAKQAQANAEEDKRKAENKRLGLPEDAVPIGTIPGPGEPPPGE